MTLETSELTNIPKTTSNTNFKDGIIDFIGGSLGKYIKLIREDQKESNMLQ